MDPESKAPKAETGAVRDGLYKRPGARVYLYHFKFRGKEYSGSTGCERIEKARAYLLKLRTDLALARVGIKPALEMPTLKEAAKTWEKCKAPQVGTRHKSITLTAFRLHMTELHDLRLDELTTQRVDAMLATYLAPKKGQKARARGGANVVLRALNTIVGYAIQEGYLTGRPYATPLLDVQEKPIPAMDADLLRRMFEALEKKKARAQVKDVLRLMIGLGLRVSEACEARVERVNLSDGTFTPWRLVEGPGENATKGKEAVALPFPAWLLPHLKRMVGDRTDGYLVPGTRNAFPSRMIANQWLDKIAVDIGIRLTPHMLRGAFASWLDRQGVGAKTIQAYLRHKQIKTTMRYIRKDMSRAKAAAETWGKDAGL